MPKIDPDTPLSNGKEIRRLRKELGLSQEELASATAMSRKTIIAVEKGAPATHAVIKPLADFFAKQFPGVTRKQLIIGKEPPEPPPVDNERIYSGVLHIWADNPDIAYIEQEIRQILSLVNVPFHFHITECTRGSFLLTVCFDFLGLNFFLNVFSFGHLRRLRIRQFDVPPHTLRAFVTFLANQRQWQGNERRADGDRLLAEGDEKGHLLIRLGNKDLNESKRLFDASESTDKTLIGLTSVFKTLRFRASPDGVIVIRHKRQKRRSAI